MSNKVLIIGATGNVGSELGRLLKEQGHSVALATSKQPKHSDQVQLNLLSGEGIDDAFEGVDRAFFMVPPGFTNPDKILSPLIEKARQLQLNKVVFMTAQGVEADNNHPLRKAEILLENSGLSYNLIRPNWFMQNFHSFWLEGILKYQKILLPVGEGKAGLIDSRDIAAVAHNLLFNDELNNQAFTLTGPESLNHDEVAVHLSEALEQTITYEDISPGVMREQLQVAGLPHEYSEYLLFILDTLKQGYADSVSPDVEKVLGRPPISFRQYAEDHRHLFKL